MTQVEEAAMVSVIVFALGTETYAVPVSHVREVLRLQEISPLPQTPPFLEGVISVRGRVLPVMDLGERLALGRAARTPAARILLVRLPTVLAGLIVDRVEEVLALPRAAIQPPPEVAGTQVHRRYLSGIARVGARLIILLDLAAILSDDETRALTALRPPSAG